jgi:hypothetical protein
MVRFLDLHNALSGLVIEKAGIDTPTGRKREFDGMWASLADRFATSKGKPDIEAVDTTGRM